MLERWAAGTPHYCETFMKVSPILGLFLRVCVVFRKPPKFQVCFGVFVIGSGKIAQLIVHRNEEIDQGLVSELLYQQLTHLG